MIGKIQLLVAAGLVGLAAAAAPAAALTTSERFVIADADEDGRISRLEYDLSGDHWFDRMDGDHDRIVTRREMKTWRREVSGWCHWERYYRELVRAFDFNRDNEITAQEYAATIPKFYPEIRDVLGSTWEIFKHEHDVLVNWYRHRKDYKLHCKEEQRRAKPFDLNGDGKVTYAEFNTERAHRYLRMDRNDDGFVTYNEARRENRRFYPKAKRSEK